MFRMAIKEWINCGQADELIFAGTELKWCIFHFGWDPGELAFAFLIRINAHVEFVKSTKTISDVHIDQRREQSFAVRAGDIEV